MILTKPMALTGAALVAVFLLAVSSPAQEPPVLVSAMNRLCDLQADTIGDNANNGLIDNDPDDSGWDWDISITAPSHSSAPSPDNTYGVTALGLLTFIDESPLPHNTRFITAILDTYIGMSAQAGADYAPDVLYLAMMTNIDPQQNYGYANLARARYDARVVAHGGVVGLAQYVADRRGLAGDKGLVPWDLGWLTEAALELHKAFPVQGYDDDAKLYAHAIANDIYNPAGYFKIDKPGQRYYTMGVAAVARTLRLTGVDHALRNDAYYRLALMQKSNGAYPWSASNSQNSLQSTAYAIKAWYAVKDHPYSKVANLPAALFLIQRQTTLGGWEYDLNTDRECTEVDGEILTSLSLVMMGRGKFTLPLTLPHINEGETVLNIPPEQVHDNARPISF